ncbi:hypothetical protein ACG7TL_007315 [Trametes sanguinea]
MSSTVSISLPTYPAFTLSFTSLFSNLVLLVPNIIPFLSLCPLTSPTNFRPLILTLFLTADVPVDASNTLFIGRISRPKKTRGLPLPTSPPLPLSPNSSNVSTAGTHAPAVATAMSSSSQAAEEDPAPAPSSAPAEEDLPSPPRPAAPLITPLRLVICLPPPRQPIAPPTAPCTPSPVPPRKNLSGIVVVPLALSLEEEIVLWRASA